VKNSQTTRRQNHCAHPRRNPHATHNSAPLRLTNDLRSAPTTTPHQNARGFNDARAMDPAPARCARLRRLRALVAWVLALAPVARAALGFAGFAPCALRETRGHPAAPRRARSCARRTSKLSSPSSACGARAREPRPPARASSPRTTILVVAPAAAPSVYALRAAPPPPPCPRASLSASPAVPRYAGPRFGWLARAVPPANFRRGARPRLSAVRRALSSLVFFPSPVRRNGQWCGPASRGLSCPASPGPALVAGAPAP